MPLGGFRFRLQGGRPNRRARRCRKGRRASAGFDPCITTAGRPKQRRDWCRRWLLLCESKQAPQPCDWREAGDLGHRPARTCHETCR